MLAQVGLVHLDMLLPAGKSDCPGPSLSQWPPSSVPLLDLIPVSLVLSEQLSHCPCLICSTTSHKFSFLQHVARGEQLGGIVHDYILLCLFSFYLLCMFLKLLGPCRGSCTVVLLVAPPHYPPTLPFGNDCPLACIWSSLSRKGTDERYRPTRAVPLNPCLNLTRFS